MKKKVLLSSILVIALCVSVIAGSTLALFTDKTQFDISATTGDVNIDAYATINALYSAKDASLATDADLPTDEFLIDEYKSEYVHERQQGYFINGGTASLDGVNLKIDRLTPGDRVDVDINVTNLSDIAIAYRYKIVAKESNLAYGMVVTIDDVAYEGFATFTSEWYPVITAPDGTPNPIPVKTFSVELPVYANNDYQTEYNDPTTELDDKLQSVEYTVIVEAVQGNAVTYNESVATIFPKAFEKALNNRSVVTTNGAVVKLDAPLEMKGNNCTVIDSIIDASGVEIEDGDVAYNLYMIGSNIVLDNTTFIASALDGASMNAAIIGEGVNNISLINGSKIIIPEGVDAYAIWDQTYGGDVTLKFDAPGMVGGDIVIGTLGTINVYVNSVEAYEEYKQLFVEDGTYKVYNWYINGVLVPVVNASTDLQDLFDNTESDVVRLESNVAATITDVSDKTIDANGYDLSLTITGNVSNLVIEGVKDTDGDAAAPVNLKNAVGDVTFVNCEFTDVSGGSYGAILTGANVNVTIKDSKLSGVGKSYGIYNSGANGGLTIQNTSFENLGSWAIMINNEINGDLVVDGCTFSTPDGVLKVLHGVNGDFTFTNNTMIGCKGHDGKPEQLVVSTSKNIPVTCTGIKTISGNTLDGVEWTQ